MRRERSGEDLEGEGDVRKEEGVTGKKRDSIDDTVSGIGVVDELILGDEVTNLANTVPERVSAWRKGKL